MRKWIHIVFAVLLLSFSKTKARTLGKRPAMHSRKSTPTLLPKPAFSDYPNENLFWSL